MNRKVKLGIIGTGLAAKHLHLPVLKNLTEIFKITAVCNHTEPKAKEFASMAGGVPYYLDYKDLISDKSIEAVLIVLPIQLNYKVTMDCIKAGKHVLVEKPLAANLAEAKKLVKLSRESSLTLMLAENFRFRKVYRRLKEIILNGTIGTPYAAMWNSFTQVKTDAMYGATKWRQNHEYRGGFITDGGVHIMAALRMLFGEIAFVSAFSESVNPDIGKPDTISIHCFFEPGMKAVLNLFYSAVECHKNELIVFGRTGTAEIKDNLLSIKTADLKLQEDFGDNNGFSEELSEFHTSIINEIYSSESFEQGYKDLQAVFSALKSAEKNRRIKIQQQIN